jgi:hypothetical protein
MSDDVSAVRKVIGVEEHAWTAELRDALVKFGGDDTVAGQPARPVRTPGAVSAGATAPARSWRLRRSARRTRPSSLT